VSVDATACAPAPRGCGLGQLETIILDLQQFIGSA